MRFDRLKIPSFGPFTDFSYNFKAKGGRDLHIFHGNNEAGKSSLLRAISNLLYGIESRSKEDFVHSYAQLRIVADLSRNNGESLSVVRRKNPANKSLVNSQGEVIADAYWQAFLGHIDKARFHSLFGLGAVELQQGNDVLLSTGGEVDAALAVASSGGTHLSEAIAAMEERAALHFKPRGKTTIRNLQDEIKALNARLKTETTRPVEWHDLQQSLAKCQAELDQIDNTLLNLDRQLSRNDRLQRGLEVINDLRDRNNEKNALNLPVSVPRGTALRVNDLITRRSQKVAEHERITASVNQLQQQISATLVQKTLTRLEPDINHVLQHEKVYKSDLAEVGRLQSATNTRKNDLLLSAKAFGLNARNTDELETLRYQSQQLTACLDSSDKFAVESALLEQNILDISSTRKRLAEIDAPDLKQAATPADKLKIQPDQGSKALQNQSDLKRIRYRYDELIGQQAKLQNLVSLQQKIDDYANEVALGLLPLNLNESASANDLSSLKIPFEKTIRDYEKQFSEQTTAISQLQGQLQDLTDESTGIQLDIDSTRENADLPDIKTLQQSRHQRDTLYKDLKAGDVSVDQDYRLSVERSDALADRLIASAESVVRLQQKQLQLSQVSARQKTLQAELEKRSENIASCNRAWLAEWELPADSVRTPAEMYEWREHWEKVCNLQLSLARAKTEYDSDHSAVVATIRKLRELLPPLNDLSGTSDTDLASNDLASLAETASLVREQVNDSLRAVDERSGASAKSDELKARYSKELEEQQQEYTTLKLRAQLALSQLVSSYSAVDIVVNPELDPRYLVPESGSGGSVRATGELPLQPGLAVLSARDHLQSRMDLVALYDQYLQSSSALEEKDRSVQKFATEVEAVSREMGLDGSIEGVVSELAKRLKVNQENTVRLDSLRQQLASEETALLQAATDRKHTEKEYKELLLALGFDESTDLLSLIPTIEKFEELDQEIDATRRSLATHAGNQTTEEFIVEAGERDPDELSADKPAMEQERTTLAQRRDELIEQRTGYNAKLLALEENSGDAADTLQLLNQAEASQQQFAVEFITLKLAAKVLKSSVEDYREANRGPLFEEASTLFRRLTGDSFLRINLDYSSDNKILIKGQRADGENLDVEQMSDGTRDQLYLAMRLSALKLHLANNQPMPLVVDDLLITFDDARTAAALEVLAEIATKTQVLVFTHHESVMNIGVERYDAQGTSFNNLNAAKAHPEPERSIVQ